jgi:hypothetical protein
MTDIKDMQPSAIIILIVCALLLSGAGLYRLQKKATTATLQDTELF